MRPERVLLVAVAAISIVVCFFLLRRLPAVGVATARSAEAELDALHVQPAGTPGATHRVLADDLPGRRDVGGKLEEGAAPSIDLPGGDRAIADGLRADLEATVFETINPTALLEVAQRVLETEAEFSAKAAPTLDGAVCFEFSEVPGDLKAELLVRRADERGKVLALRVTCEGAGSPFLAGATRQDPSLDVTAWYAPDGTPEHLMIMTTLSPRGPRSQPPGIDINVGSLNCGVGYYMDLGSPNKSKLSLIRMKEGLLDDEEIPLRLEGPGPPDESQVGRFAGTLLALHRSLE